MTNAIRNIHKRALLLMFFSIGGLFGVDVSHAQIIQKQEPPTKVVIPSREPLQAPDSLVMLESDGLYFRPDMLWGFRMNLSGFVDLSKVSPSRTRVAFGAREDSIGMTLSQLYVMSIPAEEKDSSSGYFADKNYADAVTDTSVISRTIRRDTLGVFQIIEYDKNEIWPQKDPENPNMSFDSFLVRRHFNALTTIKGSMLLLHLSKTDYRSFDSTIFTDIIRTFELIDPRSSVMNQR